MSSLRKPVQAGIASALARVQQRIIVAAERAGRAADDLTLIAVSKTFSADAVLAACAAGQTRFGENYVQEAVQKITQVGLSWPRNSIEWHFIGPIQSNKTRPIAEHVDWVQSVDRLSIAQRLAQQRPPGFAPLMVLIQVNISGEATKSGVAPDAVAALAHAIAALPRLRLRGLMAIPAAIPAGIPAPSSAAGRAGSADLDHGADFRAMRALFDRLCAAGLPLDTLSIGMSDDIEIAIANGATMLRVGTAIFGSRS